MNDRPTLEAVWRATKRFQELTAYQPKRVVMHTETFRALQREPVHPETVPLGMNLAMTALGMPVETDDRMPPNIVRVIWDEDEIRAGGLEYLHSFALAEPVDSPD